MLAVDASRRALAYASTNVSRLQLQGAVDVREGNWCEFSGAAALEGQCGVVVSNPPYIPSHKLPDLQPEVSRCADGCEHALEFKKQMHRCVSMLSTASLASAEGVRKNALEPAVLCHNSRHCEAERCAGTSPGLPLTAAQMSAPNRSPL